MALMMRSGQQDGPGNTFTRPLAIIADDLTGACDTGIFFAKVPTVAWCNLASFDATAADVHVFVTNSRHDEPDVAAEKVRAAVHTAISAGLDVVYKKVDSTLKGNIGAEVEATLRASNKHQAFIAPAFPSMGRRIQGGCLRFDQPHPGIAPNLLSTLRSQTPLPISHLTAVTAEQGLIPAASDVPQLFVFDTNEVNELRTIAAAAYDDLENSILVGSGGLARQLADLMIPNHSTLPEIRPVPHHKTGPTIIISGSQNPVSAQQLQHLELSHGAQTHWLTDATVANLAFTLTENRPLILKVGARTQEETTQLRSLLPAISKMQPNGLVFIGGDTAGWVCDISQTRGIMLGDEILRGLPHGTFIGGLLAGTRVCTKAGGFGNEIALEKVFDHLTNLA